MTQPVRILMKRIKGFNLQEESKKINGLPAILCSRPSKFSNPFRLMGDMIYVDAGYRRKVFDKWVLFYPVSGYKVEDLIKLFRELMMDLNSHTVEEPIRKRFQYMRDRIRDLEGHNLACYCKADCACHTDVFFELLKTFQPA